MEIRQFKPEDVDHVIRLWEICGLTVPWNDPKLDIQMKLEVQPELFLVGAIETRIVATVMAGYDGHRGWLYSLAVDPEYQRAGLGRNMVEAAILRLKTLGCRKVNLQVRTSNVEVLGFYEKIGFSMDDTVSMGKRL